MAQMVDKIGEMSVNVHEREEAVKNQKETLMSIVGGDIPSEEAATAAMGTQLSNELFVQIIGYWKNVEQLMAEK